MNKKDTIFTIDELQIFDNYSDLVTVAELAQMLRIGRNTAYDLIRCGAIPSIKVGRQIRITKAAVSKFISE